MNKEQSDAEFMAQRSEPDLEGYPFLITQENYARLISLAKKGVKAEKLKEACEKIKTNLRDSIAACPENKTIAFVCSKLEIDCDKALKEFNDE